MQDHTGPVYFKLSKLVSYTSYPRDPFIELALILFSYALKSVVLIHSYAINANYWTIYVNHEKSETKTSK